MGFNYNWFKSGAVTLSNQLFYNRYFKSVKSDEYQGEGAFTGLNITQKLDDYVRDRLVSGIYFTQRERYYPIFSMTNNVLLIFALFLPPIFGGVASLACVFFFIMAVLFSEVDFPWWLLAATIGWNLFWLNLNFVLNLVFSKFKGAYIDREKQTISFTWHVSGNPEKMNLVMLPSH
ncbi:hypothetical protein KO495_08790 [Colwellia sp. D2M02]|uniref:hypothetical protein n=1 Tax=Colwellia sp. D2M02 TaxID=2841562 RepID=UPI001C09B179|nr:hypothetical protein [Colwellia sp. D2M02]MBU2893425.1 hypothetical protein [Colwellia sp. D2M02]